MKWRISNVTCLIGNIEVDRTKVFNIGQDTYEEISSIVESIYGPVIDAAEPRVLKSNYETQENLPTLVAAKIEVAHQSKLSNLNTLIAAKPISDGLVVEKPKSSAYDKLVVEQQSRVEKLMKLKYQQVPLSQPKSLKSVKSAPKPKVVEPRIIANNIIKKGLLVQDSKESCFKPLNAVKSNSKSKQLSIIPMLQNKLQSRNEKLFKANSGTLDIRNQQQLTPIGTVEMNQVDCQVYCTENLLLLVNNQRLLQYLSKRQQQVVPYEEHQELDFNDLDNFVEEMMVRFNEQSWPREYPAVLLGDESGGAVVAILH